MAPLTPVPSSPPSIFQATAQGLREALAHVGYEVRLNTRSDVEEHRTLPDGEWRPLDGRHRKAILNQVREECSKIDGKGQVAPFWHTGDLGNALWDDVVTRNEVDPFLEYLAGLPPWDRTPRLHAWLPLFFQVKNADLAAWAARHTWVGAVRRAYEPGAMHRITPVLICRQEAIGKSLVCRTMVPRPEWFVDSFNIHDPLHEQVATLEGAVIVEWPETAGMTRGEVNKHKQFLTSTQDKVRKRYDRQAMSYPRRWVMVATSNDDMPLPNSPDGNSRYMPIYLDGPAQEYGNGPAIIEAMNRIRDDLWAEALVIYRSGADTTVVPHGLVPVASEARDMGRYRNEGIEEAAEDFLDVVRHNHFTLGEAKTYIASLRDSDGRTRPLDVRNATEGQVRTALHNLGCQSPTTSTRNPQTGKTGRWWQPPQRPEPEPQIDF